MIELASLSNLTAQALGTFVPAILSDATSNGIPASIAAPELRWAGLILLLPVISAVLCGLCAAMRVKSKLPGLITAVSLVASFGVTLWLFLSLSNADGPVAARTVHLFDWITLSWEPTHQHAATRWTNVTAPFALYIDSLTLLWMLFVTGLGSLIAIYATEYMESDVGKGYARFFGCVSIFLFAMGALVMGGNLILLYLGWEGVGLASYLLVGYYYTKPSAVDAAKKAFIMNRIGDAGLALGIFLIWVNYGSLEYSALFEAMQGAGADGASASWTREAIPYLIMLGAFGKSAQFPLFTWLPDAMEGPTPVSALIHAATMVTAGVYLIARLYPLFELHPHALETVAWIGCFTALLAATIGMAQYDIKRVFAYSTVSQLGYMFLGLGVGTSFGAVYHVFTHAFFKALLFLCCGAIMHGMAGQLDLRKMSGLRNVKGFGIISWTFLVGCLCLAAFPFSSGYFSKDAIIGQAFASDNPNFNFLGWVAVLTAGLTSYYAFRVWFRVCGGPTKYEPGDEVHSDADEAHDDGHGHGHAPAATTHHGAEHWHPHGPRIAINAVLLVICAGALLAAVPAYNAMSGGSNWVQRMVAHSSAFEGAQLHDAHGAEHAHHALSFTGIQDVHTATSVVASVFGMAGLLIALYLHLLNRSAADHLRNALLSNSLTRWLPIAMENKWYVDEIYHWTFRVPLWALAHVSHFADKNLIDGVVVNGVARLPMDLARLFQPLYNGVLQGYAATMAGGLALILAWVFWIWMQGV